LERGIEKLIVRLPFFEEVVPSNPDHRKEGDARTYAEEGGGRGLRKTSTIGRRAEEGRFFGTNAGRKEEGRWPPPDYAP